MLYNSAMGRPIQPQGPATLWPFWTATRPMSREAPLELPSRNTPSISRGTFLAPHMADHRSFVARTSFKEQRTVHPSVLFLCVCFLAQLLGLGACDLSHVSDIMPNNIVVHFADMLHKFRVSPACVFPSCEYSSPGSRSSHGLQVPRRRSTSSLVWPRRRCLRLQHILAISLHSRRRKQK